MQPTDAQFARHMLARMTDYCRTDGISWTRRLWDVGSVLGLEELWEAGTWQPRKVLSSTAVDWQRNELVRLVGPDLGMGDKELRKELTKLLRAGAITDPSPGHRRLRHLIDHARHEYLDRWATALAEGKVVKPERLARVLTAHLLDLGYTAQFLTVWVTNLRDEAADTTAIVTSAAELARASAATIDVLLALERVPERPIAERTAGWRSKTEVSEWLTQHGYSRAGVRCGGGFVYQVKALDVFGAADQVRVLYDRMQARFVFARRSRGEVRALPNLWVAGHPEPVPLAVPARGADVLTLRQMDHLYDVATDRNLVDDALELASAINEAGSPSAAIAGAWAAVESALSHPGDPVADDERGGKAVAADRLAAIVACSWPRAELTALVHRHRGDDDLARRRDECRSNRDKCAVLAEEIMANGLDHLDFRGAQTRGSDIAAAELMRDLLVEPARVLGEIKLAVQIALRRLYRARNVVLHGGALNSVTASATLRTAAPLVGAGLDRIAHAWWQDGLEPLGLAARAELAVSLVGGETGLSPVDLLQRAGSTP